MIRVEAAHLHNLRNVTASLPIGRLSVVTGVSGSGKSTLARDVILDNLAQAVSQRKAPAWHGCVDISGWEHIDRVLEVDQTPIGKTPRSCPATYRSEEHTSELQSREILVWRLLLEKKKISTKII